MAERCGDAVQTRFGSRFAIEASPSFPSDCPGVPPRGRPATVEDREGGTSERPRTVWVNLLCNLTQKETVQLVLTHTIEPLTKERAYLFDGFELN